MKQLFIFLIVALPLLFGIYKVFNAQERKLELKGFDDNSSMKLYAARCASCHGIKGEGTDVYPKINNLEQIIFLDKTTYHMAGKVKNSIMSAKIDDLSSDEAKALWQFLRKQNASN